MEVTNKINTVNIYHGKDAKKNIFEWVDKIWYSDSIISNDMILNSFRYAGISSELEESQDD